MIMIFPMRWFDPELVLTAFPFSPPVGFDSGSVWPDYIATGAELSLCHTRATDDDGISTLYFLVLRPTTTPWLSSLPLAFASIQYNTCRPYNTCNSTRRPSWR